MEKWIGRVALVTGASAGFGESIAKRLVEHGMKVVGCARNIEKIQIHREVLVDLLPELLKRSRAENTCKKYELAFKRWDNWGLRNSLGSGDILPAKVLPVAIYLSSLIQSANTPAPVVTSYYAIKWFHEVNGLVSPTYSKVIVNILEAARRILGKPTYKKDPITVDIILSIYNSLYQEKNIKNQRIICAIILAYAGFLRSAEL